MNRNMMEAYAEINILLDYIPKEYRNKIPIELQKMFESKKLPQYKCNINRDNPFDKEKLKKETLVILSVLQYNFWCETKDEKEKFRKLFTVNEMKYQNELKERYNINDIFKNENYNLEESQNTDLLIPVSKKTFFQKIIEYIKSFFKI